MHKQLFFFLISSLFCFTNIYSNIDQPKVAIVGAGGAGLTTAWLLENDYNVTLFEKNDRLGGHCHTVDVNIDGKISHIDVGAEFFSDYLFPHFMQLLKVLNVPISKFVLTNTFFTTDGSETIFLPPINQGKVAWESLKPSNLFDLVQFKHVLDEGKYIIDIQDTAITVKQFVDELNVTEDFKHNFLYPFMAAAWGVNTLDIQSFAAYDVLIYFVMNQPSGLHPIYWNEIVGGTKNYIRALSKELNKTDIKLSSNIADISYKDNVYTITEDNGNTSSFDILVLATNSMNAAELIKNIPEKKDIASILKQIKYYDTTIAIHGDARFMPKKRSAWAVANIGYNGVNSSMTIFKSWKSETKPIFRSWLSHPIVNNHKTDSLPSPLYALIKWQHPTINPNYFHAQKAIQTVNGNQNLWFAGMYTYNNDSHESVIISAMNVARSLAPHSERLKLISNFN